MRKITPEMQEKYDAIAARFDDLEGTITQKVRKLSEEFGPSEPMIRVILKRAGRIGRG